MEMVASLVVKLLLSWAGNATGSVFREGPQKT